MAKDYKCCYPCEMFGGYEAMGAIHNADCIEYHDCKKCEIALTVARVLYNAGYRKLPKDSVVLSKENYDKLCHLAYFGYDDYYEKGSKETAEKILNELYCTPKEQVESKIKELARLIGVEIKE